MSNLEEVNAALAEFPPFWQRVGEWGTTEDALDTLQINIGLKCNLACKHCHVESSPARTEEMTRETLEACLRVYKERGFSVIDITGGAPEMNPHYEWFLREASAAGARVMTRSNLVICQEPGYEHLPELWAELGVVVIASLPHYIKKKVEKQRGADTFDPIIAMLQRLCALGYGKGEGAGPAGKTLELDLVFNPSGAVLPPDQAALEREYKQKLSADFGIDFDNLFVITNAPGGRFGARLLQTGNMERYMNTLIDAFNPDTLPAMMCRTQLSVSWDGGLYDCDFNQAVDMPCRSGLNIVDLANDPSIPLKRDIVFGNHCYSCCAGAGSS
ncbi:MAG: arsenosugar biosynthesis radical SAM protein ArsS [Eggerthellaceae bacterium]|nr:arsenosugar biosynthesis radical SAM protein ArsS [Eggerthellaceae bacterium]